MRGSLSPGLSLFAGCATELPVQLSNSEDAWSDEWVQIQSVAMEAGLRSCHTARLLCATSNLYPYIFYFMSTRLL
jgi:hypothetical protein